MTTAPASHEMTDWLEAAARELGLAALGCLPTIAVCGDAEALAARYAAWQAAGNAGLLPYLERSLAARTEPLTARPWARSVLVFAFPHAWDLPGTIPDLPAPAAGAPAGVISRYANGTDYHMAARPLLAGLLQRLETCLGHSVRHEGGADAWAVPDRYLARRAGLGVIGRNQLLHVPGRGCRLFLAGLFVDAALPAAAWPGLADSATALPPTCDGCGRCLAACPTGALRPAGGLHLAPCRSYLTMEYRGALDAQQQVWLGDSLFGCDACSSACPPMLEIPGQRVDLEWLLTIPAADLRRRLHGTPLAHAGPTLLKRNAAAILGHHPGPEPRRLLAHVATTTGSAVIRDTIAATAR
jgi:epoxyqueuosine reductase